MANYSALITSIENVIRTNGSGEITGAILQNTLKTIVNTIGKYATFAGVATTSTNPTTPDGDTFYIANGAGTYTNFNNLVVDASKFTILYYDTTWTKLEVDVPSTASNITYDNTESGITATNVQDAIDEVLEGASSDYKVFNYLPTYDLAHAVIQQPPNAQYTLDSSPYEYQNGLDQYFINNMQTDNDFVSVGASKFIKFNLQGGFQQGVNAGYTRLAILYPYSFRNLFLANKVLRVIFDATTSASTATTFKLTCWANQNPSGVQKPEKAITLQPNVINHIDVELPAITSVDVNNLKNLTFYIYNNNNNIDVKMTNIIVTDETTSLKEEQIAYPSIPQYYGKRMLYIGDSISSTSWDYWCRYLNNYYNLAHNNRASNTTPAENNPAIPNATIACDANGISLNSANVYSIWYRCANHRMDIWNFDVISLYGGTNDNYLTKTNGLGAVTDKPYVDNASTFSNPSNYVDTWSDTLTFAQFYMGCVEMLKRDFPTKEIVLCTLLPCTGHLTQDSTTGMTTGETLSAFIIRVAKKYDLKVIPWYWSIYSEKDYAIRSFTNEGTHPTKNTGYIMAQRFAEVLRVQGK